MSGAVDAAVRNTLLALALSPVLLVSLLVGDRARVATDSALSRVLLGRPFSWMAQDRSSLDPPERAFPLTLGVGLPQEHPTEILVLGLIGNLVLLSVAAGVLLTGATVLLRTVEQLRADRTRRPR